MCVNKCELINKALEIHSKYLSVLSVNNENHNFKVFGTEKLTSCFFFSSAYFRENTHAPYRGYTSVIESSSTE